MACARPVVSVYQADAPEKKTGTVAAPHVFIAPLRHDLVRYIHANMNKNRRQACGVKDEAGYDSAAASWGTGRAVARIPRAPGGGTSRAGQGAFGNMCRGGGMFNPTKTWRKWHRKVNITQKRHAVAAAIAASALPALVMARGHHISEVAELPLVVSDAAQTITKTKDAAALLKGLGCTEELEKVQDSKKLRAGKGKGRSRRYTMRKGPLVIFAQDDGITRAMRNIPGVDICHVDRLNLLQLAPGGSFGRFIVWTESAIKRLGALFGTYNGASALKKNYHLPRAMMANADVTRIINSDEVQASLRPAKKNVPVTAQKKNPLKNRSVLGRVSPSAVKKQKLRIASQTAGTKEREAVVKAKRANMAKAKAHHKASNKFFADMMAAYKTAAPVADEE